MRIFKLIMSISLRINRKEIADVDLSSIYEFLDWNPTYKEFLSKKPGEEHYKLLFYIAKLLAATTSPSPAVISDIGTLYGSSALSFAAAHPTIQVTTYDILNVVPNVQGIKTVNNVLNIKRKIMSGQLDIHNICKSQVVLMDIDPHEGSEEVKFINLLLNAGFKGLLLVDDIHLNDGMKAFWNGVTLPKYDLTDIGHWTGTGLIVFDVNTIDVTIV